MQKNATLLSKFNSLRNVLLRLSRSCVKVYVAGYDVSKDPLEAFQRMGYCPQVDALWPTVTLEEHLELFARIRGVPWDEVKRVIDQ